MRMQVKLEIGHKAACREEPTSEGFTHDWTVFVRGFEGKDISHFVDKVVFHLHESFPRPKRAVKEPPFKLDERGYGSFELKIEVCFKTKNEPRRVTFTYDLLLPLMGYPPVTNVRTEALTFTHPNEDFMKKLTKGGGLQISSANGVSGKGLTNGHGTVSRDETKESTHKNLNIPDSDKVKKSKLSKSGSKPLNSNSNVPVVGMKRSPPSHNHTPADGTTKKKKKPSENLLLSSKGKPSAANDTTASAQLPLATEVKDLKVKFKAIPPKEQEKRKDHGSDSHHKGKVLAHSSKGKDLKGRTTEHRSVSDKKAKSEPNDHKTKVKKKEKLEQKDSTEKKKKEKKEEKQKKTVEKVTIRRSSGDSWASSGGLMPNVLSRNKALGKLLREISDDEEEAEDLPTPFKKDTAPAFPKFDSKEQNSEKSASTSSSKHKAKENKLNVNDNNNHSDSKSVSHAQNGIAKMFNSGSEANDTVKASKDVKDSSPGRNQEKNGLTSLPKKELYDLYKQITNCQDSNSLQKVVDIIETTGRYTVSEKTFDFDLYCLDKAILRKIQKCLSPR